MLNLLAHKRFIDVANGEPKGVLTLTPGFRLHTEGFLLSSPVCMISIFIIISQKKKEKTGFINVRS